MGILYILLGAAFGGTIAYLRLQNNTPEADQEALHLLKQTDRSLDLRVKSVEENHERLAEDLKSTKEALEQRESAWLRPDAELTTVRAEPDVEAEAIENDARDQGLETVPQIIDLSDEVVRLEQQVKALSLEKSELETEKATLEEGNLQMTERMERLEKDLNEKAAECKELNLSLAKEQEEHEASKKKLKVQRTSFEALGKKFNSDFENMATKILEELEVPKRSKY